MIDVDLYLVHVAACMYINDMLGARLLELEVCNSFMTVVAMFVM
jgi:hypothetical protein